MEDCAKPRDARPHIGVMFDCCQVYVRIYRRPDQPAYLARCPRCLRSVRVEVAEGGEDAQFIRVS